MLGLGSLIGAGVGAVGSIFGGISAAKAAKQLRRDVEAQKMENRNWYERRYNEDATQRADAQRVLALTEEAIRNRNRAAAGTAAVMGGSTESVAAAKAAGNQAAADAAAQIAAAGAQRKDQIENQYLTRNDNLNAQLNNMTMNKANQIAAATGAVGKAAGTLGGVLDEYYFGDKS